MVKNTLETLIGLVGLTVALTGCPGDDTGSDTNNTTNPTTGVNTTGMESTGGDTMTEPPATDDGGSSSEGGGDTTTSGPPMGCDPPCPMGEECVDGACFPAACDPPCGADQMCVAGVCEDMPPPDSSDYGPCDMCAPGEMPIGFEGVDGCWCAPGCDGAGAACPAPNEGTADAQCVITTMAGADPSLCALVCAGDEECPAGATCIDVGGGTVCMHPPPM